MSLPDYLNGSESSSIPNLVTLPNVGCEFCYHFYLLYVFLTMLLILAIFSSPDFIFSIIKSRNSTILKKDERRKNCQIIYASANLGFWKWGTSCKRKIAQLKFNYIIKLRLYFSLQVKRYIITLFLILQRELN